MRSRAGLCLLLASIAALAPLRAGAQGIGVYIDSQGWTCALLIPPTTPTTCYVLAQGAYAGLTGAEFGIQGWTDPFLVTATPSPDAAVALGDPVMQRLGSSWVGGTNIAFADCQTTVPVLLFTLTVLNPTGTASYPTIRVRAHSSPSNGTMACPLITLCDAPVFTAQCVLGGQTAVVPGPTSLVPHSPSPADGATGVVGPTLQWIQAGPFLEVCSPHDQFYDIYFGTTADPPLAWHTMSSWYCCPVVAPLTTYYWRVVQHDPDGHGTFVGPVWSFTTGDFPIAAGTSTWGEVKGLYR